jgi:hypothetical protein
VPTLCVNDDGTEDADDTKKEEEDGGGSEPDLDSIALSGFVLKPVDLFGPFCSITLPGFVLKPVDLFGPVCSIALSGFVLKPVDLFGAFCWAAVKRDARVAGVPLRPLLLCVDFIEATEGLLEAGPFGDPGRLGGFFRLPDTARGADVDGLRERLLLLLLARRRGRASKFLTFFCVSPPPVEEEGVARGWPSTTVESIETALLALLWGFRPRFAAALLPAPKPPLPSSFSEPPPAAAEVTKG